MTTVESDRLNACVAPSDEPERIKAVRRYDILDTPPDGAFDRITAIAARRFNVPISIISIVDHDRIWFKSHHGLDVEQIGRDPGLCASAILSNDPHVLPDAKLDVRSLANPLVAGEFGLRFYAGVPLRTSDGYNLGTLCVIDRKPHAPDNQQMEDLKDLAAVVMDQMELRLSARRAAGHAAIMVREIDHRVMNSLQFVASMLRIQGRADTPPEVLSQLETAANRVGAVARVHRHFSVDVASEQMEGLGYIRRLCADLAGILERQIEVGGQEAMIPTTCVQPIGLIVNELVTNAAKHGDGTIKVGLDRRDGGYSLSVCDEGEGLPVGFDPLSTANGLGMKVIVALAKQLNGSVTAEPNAEGRGTCFTVSFSAS